MPLTSTLFNKLEELGYNGAGLVVRDGVSDLRGPRRDAWEEIHQKADVDAVFFRGAVPLVAFAAVDHVDKASGLHKRLWNLSRLPLLIVESPAETAALSCFVEPGQISPFLTDAGLVVVPTDGSAEALSEFSRFHVEAGQLTRRWPGRFSRRSRVDKSLLRNLKRLRSKLAGDGDRAEAIDALIGRTIFLRYMEDRSILTTEQLRTITLQDSVVDVLRSGSTAAYGLFASLSSHFNGDVLASDDAERATVTDEDLHYIADFLSGTDLATGQSSFWPYDFAVIPTELISSIYEQLLDGTQRADAAYYTPRSVVELILDEVMPGDGGMSTPTVLDPSCGSGIFLAEAFRRLARQRRGASFEELSDLLVSSIFGVDKNPKAVAVASLSLYLTLLEHIDPPAAWDRARLPSLVGRNLIVSDFFAAHQHFDRHFDIIVGNPPWRGGLSAEASRYVVAQGLEVPDKQMAWAFVLAAIRLLSDGGQIGLLLPAKSFLHNKRKGEVNARLTLFNAVSVSTVIDLSCLRRSVFASASAPACVITGQLPRSGSDATTGSDQVLHIAPKSSPLQLALDGFLISQSDIETVPYSIAREVPEVWKMLLWGDMNDFFLIMRLREQFPTLASQVSDRGWVSNRGFQVAGGSKMDPAHLNGRTVVPAEAIDSYSIDRSQASKLKAQVLHRTRTPELYSPPKVLIRRGLLNQQRIAATLSDDDAIFNDSVIGVSGPAADRSKLAVVAALINSSFAQYFHFMTGSAWGVERDTVDKSEHLSIPIPPLLPEQEDEVERLVDQLLRQPSMKPALRSHLDEIFFTAFGLTDRETALVRDRVTLAIDHFRSGWESRSLVPPEPDQIDKYLTLVKQTIVEMLPDVIVRPTVAEPASFYIAASFEILAPGSVSRRSSLGLGSIADEMATEKSDSWVGSSTVIQPSLLVLDGSVVHVIKPREARYWTPTAAYSDGVELIAAVAAAPTMQVAQR